MAKENSKVFLLILLGMLTAFGPFVTDMYLPSLPSMGDYFSTTSSMVQLGLTTSMIGLAVGQVFFGPLSDRYGRRLPLLVAMWLFIASTLLCLFSRSIEQFVAFRLVQGIAGAGGIVISRSVATDKFSGRELAKMLAVIGAINGVAPVAAPIVGGLLTDLIGWQGIFWILFGLGILLLAGCMRFRESLPATGVRPSGGVIRSAVSAPFCATGATCATFFRWPSPKVCCLPTSLPRPSLCSSITVSLLLPSASVSVSMHWPSGWRLPCRSSFTALKVARWRAVAAWPSCRCSSARPSCRDAVSGFTRC